MNYYKTGCSVGGIVKGDPLARAEQTLLQSIAGGMVFDAADQNPSPPPMDPREGLYCYGEHPNGEPRAFWLRREDIARSWLEGGGGRYVYAVVLDCRQGLPPRVIPSSWTGYQVGADTATSPAKTPDKISRRAAIGTVIGATVVLGLLVAEGWGSRVQFR